MEWYTIAELAAMSGLCRRTVYYYVWTGKVHGVKVTKTSRTTGPRVVTMVSRDDAVRAGLVTPDAG